MSQDYEVTVERQVNEYTWVTADLDTIDTAQENDEQLYITVTHPITDETHQLEVTETDRNRRTGLAVIQTNATDETLLRVGQREPQTLYEKLTQKLKLLH